MQKILVPTDFSDLAENALKYAIGMAAHFQSELLIYHVYEVNKRHHYQSDLPEGEQLFVKKLQDNMDSLVSKYQAEFAEKGILVQTRVEEGHVFTLFDKIVKRNAIDMIIMGSQGASGLEKVIFGSTASDALDLAKVPVLVVPPNFSKPEIEHIILATDFQHVTKEALAPLIQMANNLEANVAILNISLGGSQGEAHRQVESLLENVKTTYHEKPMSKSIHQSINEFIQATQFDLLYMIRREKGFFESLFETSITKEQIYDTPIPVMVIPEK